MKLALFFFLSVAVHATAFLIPFSMNGRAPDSAIAVTILPIGSMNKPKGSGGAKKSTNPTSINRTSPAALNSTPVIPESPTVDSLPVAANKSVASIVGVPLVSVANTSSEVSVSPAGTGGNNLAAGRFGVASGSGSGNGEGPGTGHAEATLTQARYRETPQPHYPDSARREGKEGRVLLSVLVDEEGRAKAIEVNTSSGHDTLDQAATEALKKWRFVPARAGGIPVETWVKVPIEFQLSNAKP
jgi:periplasmic protein TonB